MIVSLCEQTWLKTLGIHEAQTTGLAIVGRLCGALPFNLGPANYLTLPAPAWTYLAPLEPHVPRRYQMEWIKCGRLKSGALSPQHFTYLLKCHNYTIGDISILISTPEEMEGVSKFSFFGSGIFCFSCFCQKHILQMWLLHTVWLLWASTLYLTKERSATQTLLVLTTPQLSEVGLAEV